MENPQKYRYLFSNSETSGRKSFFSPMIISSFLTFTSFTCVYVWLYSYKSLSFTHALFTNHQFMFILYQINGTVSSTCYWAITFFRNSMLCNYVCLFKAISLQVVLFYFSGYFGTQNYGPKWPHFFKWTTRGIWTLVNAIRWNY